MEYPSQDFEEHEETAYLLHKENGKVVWNTTLTQARFLYKEQLDCGKKAMITRQRVKTIQLNSFDRIQGNL